jgi:hypothetical protein
MPVGFFNQMKTGMAYESLGRVSQNLWSRRSFMKSTVAGVATGVAAASGFSRRAVADEGLRTIGLGVSIVNEVQEKATKDLGFPVGGQAMGYGDMFSKMLNQNDQYEIAEGYFNDMRVTGPAKVWQAIPIKKLKDWDKVTNVTKTGKLIPESNEGQGDAPFKFMWCDAVGLHHLGPGLAQCRFNGLQPQGNRSCH